MKPLSILGLPSGANYLAFLLTVSLAGSVLGQGSPKLTPRWSVAAADRAYLGTTANWPRGVAINPLTGHVLIPMAAITSPYTPEVHILSGADGSDLGTLNVTGVAGGHADRFPVDQIGVAEDGVIYAATLAVNTPVFQIWRWASESAAPQSVYGPAPGGPTGCRIGDSFAVRGAGAKTQIIASGGPTQITTTFTIFTTADGTNFTAHEIALPAGVAANEAGRGLAWDGTNNAFYAIAAGSVTVHHIGFDLAAGTSTLLNNVALPAASLGISLYSQDGFTILPTIQDTGAASAHGLTVFDLTDPTALSVAEGGRTTFPTPAVTDGNVTGATAVGAGLVVGLSTHNGVVALTLTTVTNAPTITVPPQDFTVFPGTASTNVSFSVGATGSLPFQYQWYFNGNPLGGATGKTLSLTNAQAANAGGYSVAVSNTKGTVRSAEARLTIASSGYPAVVAADQPLAYWRLDETGGTVARDLWGGHNGTYANASLGLPGCSLLDANKAAGFDSSKAISHASVPLDPSLDFTSVSTPFTLEGWVQFNPFNSTTRAQRLFSDLDYHVSANGSGYGFGIVGTHSVRFTSYGIWDYDLDLGTDNAFVPGRWYYLAGVSDGAGSFIFYVNGQQVGSMALTGDSVTSTTPMTIGNDPYNFDWLDGQLDELAIYNTALSSERIAAHYNARYGDTTSPLIRAQPVSLTNYAGVTVSFAVIAEGSGTLSYQWRKDGADISGANSETLTVGPLAAADAGNYSVVVTGVGQTTSAAARLTVLNAPQAISVTDSLVLHLKFDGDYLDYSGRGNHGTNVGVTTFVADGQVGQALHLSTDVASSLFNYVTLGLRPDLQFSTNVDFSVAYWVRLPAGATPGDVPFLCNAVGAGSSPGYFFGPTYTTGGWRWTLANVGGTYVLRCPGAADSINDGNWHFVAQTFSRTGLGVTYLDGAPVASVSVKAVGNLDTGEVTNIGQDPTGTYDDGASDVVEFDLDEMGVWRRVLSATEVGGVFTAAATNKVGFVSAPVSLRAQRSGSQVQLTWSGGLLQSADTVNGAYSDVAGATSPSTLTPTSGQKFYRLRQ